MFGKKMFDFFLQKCYNSLGYISVTVVKEWKDGSKRNTPIFGKDDILKRNLLKKLSAALVITAVLFTSVFSASIFVNAASNSFTPRLEAPSYDNKYYYNGNYNIFYQAGYGMPNCTAYAFGRAYEILGTEPNLSWNGASQWYDYNRNNGYYPYGKTPKVGAIACWTYGTGGHVAVVESIDSNGYMTISNSAWQGTNFYLTHAYASDSNPGGNSWWTFQGYIYIIDSDNYSSGNNDYDDVPAATVSTDSDYETGTYVVDANPAVNFRSGYGLGSSVIGSIPDDTKLVVTKTAYASGYNWGFTKYNNVEGWVALEYCNYISSSTELEQPTTVAPTTKPAPTTAPATTVAPTTVPATTQAPATVPATTKATTVSSTSKGLGRGDVDGDGVISILDATLVQQYLAGMKELSRAQRRWGDVDGNGYINIDDATNLQRMLLY